MDGGRERQYTEESPQPGRPWGFFLVLASIIVVAFVYSVSIIVLYLNGSLTPETVFGAMAACFTVIGTLVGTYFGVKAGLDGQDKLKQALSRDIDAPRGSKLAANERDGGRKDSARRAGDEHVERTWQGGSA